jgi:hypothetical protein
MMKNKADWICNRAMEGIEENFDLKISWKERPLNLYLHLNGRLI